MWIFAIELPPCLDVGSHLRIFHGYGLVIHPSTVIGDDVTLRHCTTLGNKETDGLGPQIGNRVSIGCNSVVLGRILVGNDALIGAASVVIRDVAPGHTVAGNPARVIQKYKER
jgi:serine acetyltransferase